MDSYETGEVKTLIQFCFASVIFMYCRTHIEGVDYLWNIGKIEEAILWFLMMLLGMPRDLDGQVYIRN